MRCYVTQFINEGRKEHEEKYDDEGSKRKQKKEGQKEDKGRITRKKGNIVEIFLFFPRRRRDSGTERKRESKM